jgi:hypothetical protein
MARKCWTFTINNYTPVELAYLKEEKEDVRYIVFQEEIGEKGTPHLQGYVQFSRKLRMKAAKTVLGCQRMHLEGSRGSPDQNRTYCTKDDTRKEGSEPFELGEMVGQGKRTDLLAVKEAIDDGQSEKELWESNFSSMVRYHRSFREYRSTTSPDRDWKTQVYVIVGPTGVGKSRECHERWPGAYWWSKGNNTWFDGYEGQEVAIFDDFHGGIPVKQLLNLTDRYPCRVEVKGGTVKWIPKIMVFTSTQKPRTWYNWEQFGGYEQFQRRIDAYKFHEPWSTFDEQEYERDGELSEWIGDDKVVDS